MHTLDRHYSSSGLVNKEITASQPALPREDEENEGHGSCAAGLGSRTAAETSGDDHEKRLRHEQEQKCAGCKPSCDVCRVQALQGAQILVDHSEISLQQYSTIGLSVAKETLRTVDSLSKQESTSCHLAVPGHGAERQTKGDEVEDDADADR